MNIIFSENKGEYLNKNSEKIIKSSTKEEIKEISESLDETTLIERKEN